MFTDDAAAVKTPVCGYGSMVRTMGWLAAGGGVMGAVVAVVAHFMSRTVPSVYYVGESRLGSQVNATLATPLVHPSWWPVLPVAVVIGLAGGLVVGLVVRRLGLSIIRAGQRETSPVVE